MAFIGGLDLATKRDFSALCFLNQREEGDHNHYEIHWIERLPHGMNYPQQVAHVRQRVSHPNLLGSALAADETGVGEAVVDMLRYANLPVSIWPIVITGGTAVTRDDTRYCHRVPKRMLVSTLSVLLESGRLRMRDGLDFADILKTELRSFTTKITQSGNEVYEAWRDSDHDDLVLSVALACWLGEKTGVGCSSPPKAGPKGPMGEAPEGAFFQERDPHKGDYRVFGSRWAESNGAIDWEKSL